MWQRWMDDFFFLFRLSIIPKYNSCHSWWSTRSHKNCTCLHFERYCCVDSFWSWCLIRLQFQTLALSWLSTNAICCRSMCVTLVFSTKGQRYLRVGLAVPLSGSVSCLRAMVAEEGRISPDQVHTISMGVGNSSRNRFSIEQCPTVAVQWESRLVTLLPSIIVFVMGKR